MTVFGLPWGWEVSGQQHGWMELGLESVSFISSTHMFMYNIYIYI